MSNWLNENETNFIPLKAMSILEDLIRGNYPIIFDNNEGNGVGKFWIMRVIAPVNLGSTVELYSSDYQANYMQVKDQTTRYLRWLKNEVYPHYHVRQ